jgi:hypothetical protein
MTVERYAEQWIEERRKLDLDWRNDRGRLATHVSPVIGKMRLAEVRTRHVVELFSASDARGDAGGVEARRLGRDDGTRPRGQRSDCAPATERDGAPTHA